MITTPLPQKTCIGVGYFDEYIFGYTEEQMIEYGKRSFAEGRACKTCGDKVAIDELSITHCGTPKNDLPS